MRYMIYNRKSEIIGSAEISYKTHEMISATGEFANITPPDKLILRHLPPISTRTPTTVEPTERTTLKLVTVNVQQRYRNGYNLFRPRLISTNDTDDKLISSVPLWCADV